MKMEKYLNRPEQDRFEKDQQLARCIKYYIEEITKQINDQFEKRTYKETRNVKLAMDFDGTPDDTQFYKVTGEFNLTTIWDREFITMVLKAVRVKLQEKIPEEHGWTTFDFSFGVTSKKTPWWKFWTKSKTDEENNIRIRYIMEKITSAD